MGDIPNPDFTELDGDPWEWKREARQWRAAFNAINDAICLLDLEGRIIKHNSSFEIMAAKNSEEITGNYCFQVIHNSETFIEGCPFLRARESRKRSQLDLQIKSKWFRITVDPVFAENGDLIRLVHVMTDITENKQTENALRESEKNLKRSQEIAKVGSWSYDLADRLWWSEEMYRIYGVSPETFALTVQSFISLIHPEDQPAMEAWIEACTAGRKPGELEFRCLLSDGAVRFISGRGELVCDAQGMPMYMSGTAHDVTERKRAEEALRQRNEELSTILDAIPVIVWIGLDSECRVITGNRAANELTGTPAGANVSQTAAAGGQGIYLKQLKEDGAEYQPHELPMQQAIATARPVHNAQIDFSFPDGRHVFTLGNAVPLFNAQGRPRGAVAAFMDITELARAEEALRESEARLKKSQEIAKLGSWFYDIQNDLFSWTDEMYRIFRIFPDAFSRNIEDFISLLHPDDRSALQEWKNDCMAGKKPGELVFRRLLPDGTVRFISGRGELTCNPEGKPIGMSGTAQDITERKKVEDALANEAIRRRILIEQSKDGIVILDQNGGVYEANRRFSEMLGYSPDEVLTLSVWDWEFLYPKEQVVEMIRNVDEAGNHFETQHRRKDGTIYDVEISTNGALFAGQKLIFCVCRDITARKQAEAERERLMAAIEQTEEAIVITDSEGTIQYVNPAFEAISGYSRSEALGQTPRILKSGEQNEAFYHSLWTTISNGRTWEGRFVNRRKNGKLYTEEATISPVRNSSGAIVNFVAVKRDITEHLRMTAQLQQAQKMESVGRLAGGVAHDYNNILSAILGFTELAMEKIDPASPVHSDLAEVLKAGHRSADITRQLLGFARKQPIAPKIIDLNETVEGMLKMLRRLIGEDIDLRWLPKAGLWRVKIDPSQLDQILANLCVNARDAIADVGKITIETDNIVFDEAYCPDHPGFVPGEFAMLALSDNGCGMDDETLNNIFEPFFTTKRMGEGTGLGLATVYGIVKQNNGYINVYSEPRQGTTFRIYLPRHSDQGVKDRKDEVKVQPSRGETVLIVEDDAAILQLTQRLLNGSGYKVLVASTPGKAFQLAEEYSGNIDLLITNVVMPNMNGKELAERIRSSRPSMKCLFMSGYTANAIAHRGVLDAGVQFIQKPFSLQDLAAKIRVVIDG